MAPFMNPSDPGAILVFNAGSSSVKFSIFHVGGAADLRRLVRGQVDGFTAGPRLLVKDEMGGVLADRALGPGAVRDTGQAVLIAGEWLARHLTNEPLLAVGHRVVHGGAAFSEPVRLDEPTVAQLEALVPLAPLHQPHNLAAIRAVSAWRPELPQVASFDTAFHRTHSALVDRYALPARFYEAGIRRYGFHGLSYASVAATLQRTLPELASGRVIVAHLGNGASLCALRAGRSVDSTMGFSTLDGLCMGTRAGSLDPGVLLHLLAHDRMTGPELERLLYRESGLLGLSGVTGDMRQLLASTEPAAATALDYFVWRIVKGIGALAAGLGGLDGIVFTAGIGENQPGIRARVLEGCAWLGCELDAAANAAHGPRITTPRSRLSGWVIPTAEEEVIARDACRVLGLGTEGVR